MANEQLTQEQAEELWNQLDAKEAGQAPVETSDDPSTDEVAGEEVAAQAAAKPAAADPYEGLPTHVKDELIGLKALVSQLSGRVRNAEGHIGGLKSQLQTQVDAASKVLASGGDAPSAREIAKAQNDPEAFEQLKADYPEFAAAIDSFVSAKLSAVKPQAPGISPEEFDRQRKADMESLREQIERDTQVEVAHRGWKKTVRSPQFVGWYTQQAPEVRQLSASDDPDDAIRLLDLFVQAQRPSAQQTSLRSAAALPSGRTQGNRSKPIEEMTPDEYWAYLDERDRQQARR